RVRSRFEGEQLALLAGGELAHLPGKALRPELLKKRLGRQLFDVEHAAALPGTLEDHHRPHHRPHTGRIGHGLRPDLAVGFAMVADVPDYVALLLAAPDAGEDAADRGLSRIALRQR